jgi:hypothetical protein
VASRADGRRPRKSRRKHDPRFPLGADDRTQYTKDRDARGGVRTATSKSRRQKYIGFEWHLFVQVADLSRAADGTLRKGQVVPQFIRGFYLSPAGAHRHEGVVDLLLALGFDDLVWDMGYSQLDPVTGYHRLRRAGYMITFDLHKQNQRGPGQSGLEHPIMDGTLFSHLLPERYYTVSKGKNEWHPPAWPRNASEAKRAEYRAPFDYRANYAWVRVGGPDEDGYTRWMCPFCYGKAKSQNLEHTVRYPNSVPEVETPPGVPCCKGALKSKRDGSPRKAGETVTLSPHQLELWQSYPLYTSDWALSFGRRNLDETVNSQLKAYFTTVDSGAHFRVMHLEKIAVLLACTAAGYNLWHARNWRIDHPNDVRKRRARRRTQSYDRLLGGA